MVRQAHHNLPDSVSSRFPINFKALFLYIPPATVIENDTERGSFIFKFSGYK